MVICIHALVHIQAYVACRDQRTTSGVFFYSHFLRQDLIQLGWKTSKPDPLVDAFPGLVLQVCPVMLNFFTWGLAVHTEVLLFARVSTSPTETVGSSALNAECLYLIYMCGRWVGTEF